MVSHSTDSLEIANALFEWEAFRGKAVLITGANGFLGSASVQALLARHDLTNGAEPQKVIAVVRDAKKARLRLGTHKALGIFEHDLAKPMGSLPNCDYIIHAASHASPRYFGVDPVGTMLPNLMGTQSLLEHALAVNASGFLFASSAEVYGDVPPEHVPTRENEFGYLDPTNVRSCYAESKRAAETLCVSYAAQHGVRATIARPFHTYGPGIDLNDGRVFADFVRDVVERKNIVLRSDGLARRAFCYVTDAVLGLLTILISGSAAQAYNLGNPQSEISVADLAELLVRLFPERGLSVERSGNADSDYLPSTVSRSSPNIDKLCGLGWRPTIDLVEGFTRTVTAIEARMLAPSREPSDPAHT